jgi:coatomer protein complex subunit epsilon
MLSNSTTALSQLQNTFYQGQYSLAVSTDLSTFEADHKLLALSLILRAQIASGDAAAAIKKIDKSDQKGTPELKATRTLAQYVKGDKAAGTKAIEELIATEGDNGVVQVIGAILLQNEGRSEEAITLLGKHQGNLEAYVYFAPGRATALKMAN